MLAQSVNDGAGAHTPAAKKGDKNCDPRDAGRGDAENKRHRSGSRLEALCLIAIDSRPQSRSAIPSAPDNSTVRDSSSGRITRISE